MSILSRTKTLSKSKTEMSWYVLYTAPRAEKVVHKELMNRGFETFLPTVKTLRVWKNRQKKMIDQVLFKSYIFVYTQEHILYKIIRIPKIVTFIHCAGKPSVISSKCIDGIKKMLKMGQEITVETEYSIGENVRITHGLLAGFEGTLVQQKGKTRFGIELKEINHVIFIEICASYLEKITRTEIVC